MSVPTWSPCTNAAHRFLQLADAMYVIARRYLQVLMHCDGAGSSDGDRHDAETGEEVGDSLLMLIRDQMREARHLLIDRYGVRTEDAALLLADDAWDDCGVQSHQVIRGLQVWYGLAADIVCAAINWDTVPGMEVPIRERIALVYDYLDIRRDLFSALAEDGLGIHADIRNRMPLSPPSVFMDGPPSAGPPTMIHPHVRAWIDEATSVVCSQQNVLGDRQQAILVEMHSLGAVTAETRSSAPDIVKRCQRGADSASWKRYFRQLKSGGYVESSTGRDGGYWLTPNGVREAERLCG